MSTYKTKSVIIGRKKGEKGSDTQPCFIALFDVNNPHKKNVVPNEILDYPEVHKVSIKGFDIHYLLPGNDLVINDLVSIEVKKDGPHIFIEGNQEKK
ncbi:MAG: hypothetical protein L6408_09435 [Nanoarchaeota archaeon]|nr:hypothetical protein [Nanoarchaeota archaeon]